MGLEGLYVSVSSPSHSFGPVSVTSWTTFPPGHGSCPSPSSPPACLWPPASWARRPRQAAFCVGFRSITLRAVEPPFTFTCRWQDPIKHLEALQGSLACLVLQSSRPHTVLVWWKMWLEPQKWQGQVLQLVSLEIARNVDALTGHIHHLLAQQYLPGHQAWDLPLCYLQQPLGKAP